MEETITENEEKKHLKKHKKPIVSLIVTILHGRMSVVRTQTTLKFFFYFSEKPADSILAWCVAVRIGCDFIPIYKCDIYMHQYIVMNTKITKRQEKKLGEASVIDYNKKPFDF